MAGEQDDYTLRVTDLSTQRAHAGEAGGTGVIDRNRRRRAQRGRSPPTRRPRWPRRDCRRSRRWRRRRPTSRRSRRRGCPSPPTPAPSPTAACTPPTGGAAGRSRCAPRTPRPARTVRTPPLCTAWIRAGGASPSSRSASPTTVASAPPPTWTKIRSGTTGPSWAASSQPIVRPPSRHRASSGPWTLKGTAPASTAARKRWMHGSPGGSPAERAHTTSGAPSCSRRSSDPRIGPRWDEDVDRAVHGGGERGRRQRGVAARGDGQRRAAGGASPSRSAATRWSRTPMRWRALCEPATLPVSSFTHTPPSPVKPRASDSPSDRAERRHVEAGTVDAATAASSSAHEGDGVGVGHAVGRWRRRATPCGPGRRRRGSGRRRRPAAGPVGHDAQDVGPVQGRGVRAPPRADGRDGHERRAHRAAVAGDHDGAATRAVELVDQLVPHAEVPAQAVPERRRPARLEHVDRRALLLDPRVVAEVEDAVPVALGAVEHVVGADGAEVAAEDLGRLHLTEPVGPARLQGLGPFAAVERAAVGGHGDDRVVGAEAEQLRRLDGRQHVGRWTTARSARARRGDRRRRRGAWRGRCARRSVLKRTSSSSVAWSLMAHTTSVFMTLWISGMCLSPMPWMLCSPKPFSSIVGHSSASTATVRVP